LANPFGGTAIHRMAVYPVSPLRPRHSRVLRSIGTARFLYKKYPAPVAEHFFAFAVRSIGVQSRRV
jgi:hypothetical protein